jgi:prepilin-type N-terminal cleavage/methylation domain-containing protein/prepilin-type processing-associated H-X9-DG protein
MTRNSHFARAFTLIELLIVIAVIAILATIAYPVYTGVLERAKVTKDMNNLRQIGIATQLYMNDNDGALFSTTGSWMSQLYPKYTAAWGIFLSPFDPVSSPAVPGRTVSDNDANSAVSYGINGVAPGVAPNIIGMSADKITKPTVFILFAPAQAATATVTFQGIANTTSPANLASSPNVTVLGNGATATSTPGGTTAAPPPPSGTHGNRTRINVLFADLHCETMPWTTFTSNTANPPSDPDGYFRWNPF